MIAWSNIPSVQDVYDNVTYLQSLGKAQTAAVKRDAEIGVAQVISLLQIFQNIWKIKRKN